MQETRSSPNRLRALRQSRGLDQYDLAVLVRRDQSMIYRYEVGKTAIPDDVKLRLASFFGVSVEYLMGWDRVAPVVEAVA